LNPWKLPREAVIGGERYPHLTDFRDILNVLEILNGPGHRGFLWLKAVAVFFPEKIPPVSQAREYLADFLTWGQPAAPGPVLIDWKLDAREILEGVNAVAGCDIREREYCHWWTFLSLFHSIREGALAELAAIRHKRLTGKKLTEPEQEFLRRHPEKFRPQESEEDKQHRQKLEQLLA
jgi:hypothetical protein